MDKKSGKDWLYVDNWKSASFSRVLKVEVDVQLSEFEAASYNDAVRLAEDEKLVAG
jgi:hypothetical protein